MKFNNLRRELPLHLMIMPGMIIALIFSYGPMAGLVMAFQKFDLGKGFFGSKWIGLDNFRYIMDLPDLFQVLRNTLLIAIMKIVVGMFIPVLFALLLNEITNKHFKRTIQTSVYLPHFLSWVILGGVLLEILSPSTGIVNEFIKFLGMNPVYFLGNERLFPFVLVITNVWKEFGFSTIIYVAALSNIDPSLYEAAIVDGAGRWKQTVHVTIPGILPIIILMATLSLGNVLNAGFEQVFVLYSPQVYSTGDIIDTMVYRLGLVDAQYSVATAVGMFKSVVSLILISLSYWLAYKFADYRIF